MCNIKSILIISLICASLNFIFSFLIIFVAYFLNDINIDPFLIAVIFGAIYGSIAAVITNGKDIKRTIIARIMGLVSFFIAELILLISGIPYRIILYTYRDSTWVQETGRLSVNETMAYGFSKMFFLIAMLISFFIVCIGIFIYKIVKKRKAKKQISLNEITV